MQSFIAISCRSVHIYHLNSQAENWFIHSLHSMGNWRTVATKMKQAVKEKKKEKQKQKQNLNKTNK